MKNKLLVLTAAAGIVFALAEPTLAAQRMHRGVDAYASGSVDRSGAYYYGRRAGQSYARSSAPFYGSSGGEALTPEQHIYESAPYGQNLPYPDRPYGDPDSW
jgi:hypothetical protein